MKDSCLRQARQGLLDDLASARADLIEISASILRKLGQMRSAQWTAATCGFNAVTLIDTWDGGTLMSPAQLVASINQFESEVTHIRELLAHVDARLAEVRAESPASGLPEGRSVAVGFRKIPAMDSNTRYWSMGNVP